MGFIRSRSMFAVSLWVAAVPAISYAATPTTGQLWPACSAAGQQYCIASASHDGVAIPVGDGTRDFSDAGIQVVASLEQDNDGNLFIDWETEGGHYQSPLAPAFSAAHLQVVLQAGDFLPTLTRARANQFHVGVEGSWDAGYLITLDGTPADTNWDFSSGFTCNADACGDDTSMATREQWDFSGAIYRAGSGDAGTSCGDFGGSYLASNAQYVESPGLESELVNASATSVVLRLANPHLKVDGGAASGAYTLWIDPRYLSSVNLTPDQAVDGGLVVDRYDGMNARTQLAAQFTVDDAGVLGTGVRMRIAPLTYSAPTLKVHPPTLRTTAPDAGTGETTNSNVGGGCTEAGSAVPWEALLLGALGFSLRGRRRSRPRRSALGAPRGW